VKKVLQETEERKHESQGEPLVSFKQCQKDNQQEGNTGSKGAEEEYEVISFLPIVSSSLSVKTTEERRESSRLEALKEMVDTEEKYVHDLELVSEVLPVC
jgi:hypothetical protein